MTASTKGTLTPQLALIFVPRIPWAKEHTMISQFRPACLALALVNGRAGLRADMDLRA